MAEDDDTLGSWVDNPKYNNMVGKSELTNLLFHDQGWQPDTPLIDIAEAGKDFVVDMFRKSNVQGVFLTDFLKVLKPHFGQGTVVC